MRGAKELFPYSVEFQRPLKVVQVGFRRFFVCRLPLEKTQVRQFDVKIITVRHFSVGTEVY